MPALDSRRSVRASVCGHLVDTCSNPTGPDLCVSAGQSLFFVAGAGLEPATSGRHRGHRYYYGLGPEATDSLGVVRDSPSLPISGYPSSTEYDGPNLDRFRTRVESRAGRANSPPAGRYPSQRTDDERFGGRVSAPIRWHTRSHRTPFRGPISERAAGVAVRARRPPSPSLPWPMGRSAGRWELGRHAGRARTPGPGRSVRVPDQLRRWTRGRG